MSTHRKSGLLGLAAACCLMTAVASREKRLVAWSVGSISASDSCRVLLFYWEKEGESVNLL